MRRFEGYAGDGGGHDRWVGRVVGVDSYAIVIRMHGLQNNTS